MIYGVLLSLIIAIIALSISHYIAIGSVTLAILIGMIIGNTVKIDKKFTAGITYSEKTILGFAIGLMGINLDFNILASLGYETLILIVLGMIVTIFSALFFAKLFNFNSKFALILGIGNAVCGASAIGATKDIIKAKEDEVGISVALVNFMGTIGIFLVPFIAILIGLDDTKAGILVGNTLQAVGQAVAGGFAISNEAGQSATVVKMGRVLMLTPLILILIYIYTSKDSSSEISEKRNTNVLKNIPSFIMVFIVFSILTTSSILPDLLVNIISQLSKYFLIISMAAIGLKITFKSILDNGKNAFFISTLIFLVQIIFTSIFILTIF